MFSCDDWNILLQGFGDWRQHADRFLSCVRLFSGIQVHPCSWDGTGPQTEKCFQAKLKQCILRMVKKNVNVSVSSQCKGIGSCWSFSAWHCTALHGTDLWDWDLWNGRLVFVNTIPGMDITQPLPPLVQYTGPVVDVKKMEPFSDDVATHGWVFQCFRTFKSFN